MIKKAALAIPTLNACSGPWNEVLDGINSQKHPVFKKFIFDSESSDDTARKARDAGFETVFVKRGEFDHGLTRTAMAEYAERAGCEAVIFMTQDCVPADVNAFSELLKSLEIPGVAVSYGRQLPRPGAPALERLSREFNYPAVSRVKSVEDIKELGISCAFCSDSFAAYSLSELLSAGGFGRASFGEDMLAAARFILKGRRVAYAAEARVCHSHAYSAAGEYLRGKAVGRMHAENPWLLEKFGSAESRGARLLSGAKGFEKLAAALQAIPKYLGYRIGRRFGGKK